MPTYAFRNLETDQIEEYHIRISEYDQFKLDNPHLERYIDEAAGTIGGVGGIKTDSGFKEVLSKVAEAHPNSALANKHKTKSIKEVKTDQLKKKHGWST